MRIGVGSKNPVKIESVKQTFQKAFPDQTIEVIGVDVNSGVSDQPNSVAEARQGALNRAKGALEATQADYGVGLEAGNEQIDQEWYVNGWAAIIDQEGNIGYGSSGVVALPPAIVELLDEGLELGAAFDKVFGGHNNKHKGGFTGFITNNVLTRTDAFSRATIYALAPFIQKDIYFAQTTKTS